VRVLLDTHVLLWWLEDSPRVTALVRRTIEEPRNEVLWSAASTWELAIKISSAKLRLRAPLDEYLPTKLRELSIRPLPIEDAHAMGVARLPMHHRDPFDRLLIAQALAERVPIVTSDAQFRRYDVNSLWD
jgi:PIN domain nuclease of toxin-antitoxin system